MSANRPRGAGLLAFSRNELKLRLVKSPDERPRPASELKAIIEDMNRRHRARRERIERDPGGKDAA